MKEWQDEAAEAEEMHWHRLFIFLGIIALLIGILLLAATDWWRDMFGGPAGYNRPRGAGGSAEL